MNSLKFISTLGALFLALTLYPFHFAEARQIKKDSTFSILVSGNCGMCKARIEEAVQNPGVHAAEWSAETQQLTLRIDPNKIDKETIKKRVAAVGHDADGLLADDGVYAKLHACCLYPRVQKKDQGTDKLVGVIMHEDQSGHLQPIQYANVFWLEAPGIRGTSDEEGVFTVTYNQHLSRNLVVTYSGFEPDTIAVLDPSKVVVVNARGNTLSEVVVTARRNSNFISSLTPNRLEVLSSQELFKAACCDLSESFETNASVDVVNSDAVTGSKQIQMLGLSGIYTQLTVENLPGPRGLATPLGLGSIAGSWIDQIQISKGVGSVANGFENMTGQINVELKKPQSAERLFFNIYGNDMGRTDVNLNLAHQLNERWSTGFLLHDNFMFNKDLNFSNNGFRDLPAGNIFSGINRWNYEDGQGVIAQFGIKYLRDDRTGGQIGFDPASGRDSQGKYGIDFDISRLELFSKIGYVFPENRHRSIGLQVSGSLFDQDSFYGLRNYQASQQGLYANVIYQDVIGTVVHKYRTGLSAQADRYQEQYVDQHYRRTEVVPGAFFEYTYSPATHFDLVAGIRGDYNNLYGWFATPRLQARYQPFAGSTIRVSAGRGQRTANILAENTAALASSRILRIDDSEAGGAYGLRPEISWNTGLSFDQTFHLFGNQASFSAEYFRSDFSDQVVVDYENPRELYFYNLDGRSFANSFQTELRVSPFRGFEVRTAYRIFDVQTEFRNAGTVTGTTAEGKLLERPLVARHRGFANLAYQTSDQLWNFDYTLNISGQKRLPSTEANPVAYQLDDYSKAFVTMNAQVSRRIGKARPIDLYIGAENLTNYYQNDPILAADDPFGQYFDTSMLWGPLSGRMIYAGMRLSIL